MHAQINGVMTVQELIDELEGMNPEAIVVFGSDYGDHCHTEQALPVRCVDEIGPDEVIEESAYSNSRRAIKHDTDVAGTREQDVVILRAAY
jgi:hypothetical protein